MPGISAVHDEGGVFLSTMHLYHTTVITVERINENGKQENLIFCRKENRELNNLSPAPHLPS